MVYLQSGCNLNAFPCNNVLNPSSRVCYNVNIQELVQMASMELQQLPSHSTD